MVNGARLELQGSWTRGVLTAGAGAETMGIVGGAQRSIGSPRVSVASTYLVVDLVGWDFEADGLFEDVASLLELDAFGPVVKGTGNVNFFGGVLPGDSCDD